MSLGARLGHTQPSTLGNYGGSGGGGGGNGLVTHQRNPKRHLMKVNRGHYPVALLT